MSSKHFVAWAATFVVLLAIDALWLSVVAKGLYQQGMGPLLAPQPRLGFAALFYLLYPVGLVIFAVLPGLAEGSMARAATLGALFGLFAYATYDLSNLAVLRDWPVGLSFLDIAWGSCVSAVAAAAGMAAVRWFVSRYAG